MITLLFFNSATTSAEEAATYNVVHLGANPDGKTDPTEAFLSAWTKACALAELAEIHMLQGRFKFTSGVIFKGPCANKAISITIDGAALWDCKRSSKEKCPIKATLLKFSNSKNIGISSIGSLGWTKKEPGVQHVTIRSVIFTGTQNGVRIKSWGRPSNGFVKGVTFQNATMVDVKNPILIDQNYCPSKKNCHGQESGIKISDISYEDIHGTSATQVVMRFDCSSTNPCKGIRLEDIKLTYRNQVAQASCKHVGIRDMESVQPERC
ncbi:hypothetical protein TanjilG_28134 [Lupinus angustifolius]|uniref:Polygalacturonase n=1 Tax=Lupinus angustifolius TaxID=3871 RepID=A0A1J7G179_LUPAN|nr:hypothetical protein TanjilG_28134 [Lupinus angustifolius]